MSDITKRSGSTDILLSASLMKSWISSMNDYMTKGVPEATEADLLSTKLKIFDIKR